MGLIDSHAHLTSDALAEQTPAVLDRAAVAGVDFVITIGVDLDDAERALTLSRSDDRVFAAMGVHPHEAGKVADGDWSRYERLASDPGIVAIGEMGLDYHYDFADRSAQREVFARQLEIARPLDKPIVIHSREAHEDTVAVLRDNGYTDRRVVFHCFTGSETEAAEIAANGWRISFTGVVTFKNAAPLRDIAAAYPIDQLMVETDSPYLSPVPVRNVRPNEPAHIAHIARFLADLRGTDYDEFVEQTSANTRAFFGLS